MTYFISRHGNLHFEEWMMHYKPLIDNALMRHSSFIIGDFRGADVFSAEYLKNKTERVTIVHCFSKPRYKVDVIDLPSAKWVYRGGFTNEFARDASMTEWSDADIAWVRAGKETSGTAQNVQRRSLPKPKEVSLISIADSKRAETDFSSKKSKAAISKRLKKGDLKDEDWWD
jgi:hypothetical protein